MRTYLSIDLDYWNGLRKQSINTFFAHIFALQLPIWIAPWHHQLLRHINQEDYDTLINVDYHSDIAEDEEKLPLTEGTWVNFVTWKKNGTYIWRYSGLLCPTHERGYCHIKQNPFEDKTTTRWRLCLKEQGLRNIPWHTIKGIGVSLSKIWLDRDNPCIPITEALGIRHWLKLDTIEQATQAKPFLRKALQ